MVDDGGKPRARTEWIITRPLDDELLVYDLRNHQVTSLNAFAAKVWKACDGESSVEAIAAKLADDGLAVSDPCPVELALEMLAKARLIDRPFPRPPMRSGSRRDFVRRFFAGGVAAGAAIATPAVVSILAPTPAQAGSGEHEEEEREEEEREE